MRLLWNGQLLLLLLLLCVGRIGMAQHQLRRVRVDDGGAPRGERTQRDHIIQTVAIALRLMRTRGHLLIIGW